METFWLKIHLAFLALSIAIFITRLAFSFTRPALVNHRAVLLPTFAVMGVVILSAVFLAMGTSLQSGWLSEKVIGLILYVILGVLAFKPTTSPLPRMVFCTLGIAVFVATYLVAKSHTAFLL